MQVSYFQLLQVSSFAFHTENAIVLLLIIMKSLLLSTFTIIYSLSHLGVSSNLIGSLSQRN